MADADADDARYPTKLLFQSRLILLSSSYSLTLVNHAYSEKDLPHKNSVGQKVLVLKTATGAGADTKLVCLTWDVRQQEENPLLNLRRCCRENYCKM